LLEHLEENFFLRGLTSFIESDVDTPLISSLTNPKAGLGHDRIYKVLKDFFEEVAASLPKGSEQAARFEKATTHWMRHTFANLALESGMSLEVLRDFLGHSSLGTTSIYVQTERDRRSRQMDDFAYSAYFSPA
jgi:integrase